MKQQQTISKILGLTQTQAAEHLGVSRQLLSLYELGKRDLPTNAQLRLAELLTQLKTSQKSKPAKTKKDDTQFQAYLKKLLHENEFQRALTERKIAAAERKLEKETRLSEFNEAIAAKHDERKKPKKNLAAEKSAEISGTDSALNLEKLQLKIDLLEGEKKILESKIR